MPALLSTALCLSLYAGPPVERPEGEVAPSAGEAKPKGLQDRPRKANRPRRFSVGLGATGFQLPTLRRPASPIDRRFTGPSMGMIGLVLFGRYAPADAVEFELSIRSGGVRFRGEEERPTVIAYDMIVSDVGVIFYLLRGPAGRLGVDAGFGGTGHLIRYDIDEKRSSQLYGSFVARLGVDVELTARRVSFIVNLRGYGFAGSETMVRNRGPLFAGERQDASSASAGLQTAISAALALAYRF